MHDAELLKRVVITWTYRHGGAGVFGPDLRRWVPEALDAPPDDDLALQARLVGAAAIVAITDDATRAWELLAAAQEMAASAADDRARLDVAVAELNVFWLLAFTRSNVVHEGAAHQRAHRGRCPRDARRGRARGCSVISS